MQPDTDRLARTGDPEVVFGAGKTPEQTVAAMSALVAAHPQRAILATRVDEATAHALDACFGSAFDFDQVARAGYVGPLPAAQGTVLIVTAGVSDDAVAAEAAITVRTYGAQAERANDVGVAGIHRVLALRDDLASADVVIVCAGMDGALPSVVGGLVATPVIAVPTSVGYGIGVGGFAALAAMLNSCAPGVVAVNIDNGFGAGVAAARIARRR